MSERFPDGYRDAVEQVHSASDKALYPYLDIAILGPYTGDCHAYLEELKHQLHDHGFEGASLASDRGSEIPDDWDGTDAEYWYKDSLEFILNNDIAIFVFLADELRRRYLPDRAFGDDGPTSRTSNPSGLNSSITVELIDWANEIDDPDERGFVIYERKCHDSVGGTLRDGKLDYTGIDDRVIDTHDIDAAAAAAATKCSNIAMGYLKSNLQKRYMNDNY